MRLPLLLASLSQIVGLTDASLRPWSSGSPKSKRAFLLNKQTLLLSRESFNQEGHFGTDTFNRRLEATKLIYSLRGGSTAVQDEDISDSEYEEEYDSEEESEEETDEELSDDEEETEEEAEENEDTTQSSSLATSMQSKAPNEDQPYDTLLTPPPMQQLIISISIMFLSQRIDIFSPRVVTIARAAFVGYIISVQLFLLYARLKVKQINDRTEITISNPLASLVEGMQKNSNNVMVKSLTSQILTSHTTVYEYDLQQIKAMQSSLLMPMVFIYFLHFRMKQMQPLLMQIATGVSNLVYSPLWQVYVLGRRLERPFGSGGGGGGGRNDGDGLMGVSVNLSGENEESEVDDEGGADVEEKVEDENQEDEEDNDSETEEDDE